MYWNTAGNTETETTGPPTSERPDWLNDDADTESQSGKAWDTANKSSATTTPTMEVSPASTKTDKPTADKGPWCKRMTIIGISALFAAAFIYSAIDGKHDGENLQWYIYCSISASIPVFFLCHYILCFPVKIINTLSVGMVCWSVAIIIVAALKLEDYPKSEENKTIREELIWKLSVVSAGLFSALYHACASKCFVTTKGKNDE